MKKHSLILINHYKSFCYLGLLLTLPSLLITTTISVNSASAADDIVTENQPSELITDKVVTAAKLEPKVESISEQQQPQLIAQTADSNPDDINKIRQELLVEPLIKLKIVAPKQTYPPGLSFAAPSAFGANIGDSFVGASAPTAGNRGNTIMYIA